LLSTAVVVLGVILLASYIFAHVPFPPVITAANFRHAFGQYGDADDQFDFPEGAETASVVSYQEDFDFSRGTEWKTSGCAAGQGLWEKTSTLPTKVSGQVTPPAYWYAKKPALDFKPDLPPKAGPCPALDPPCYRCINTGDYKPQYATGDLCAFGGGQHCGNLTSPRINLYNVPPPIVLEFKNCLERPLKAFTIARVEIAVNGGEFFNLKTFQPIVEDSPNCTTTKIDLSDYANSIIQLRWFMMVVGISSYATNAYGWVVDDVKVIGGFDSSVDEPNPDQRLYVADTRNHRITVWKYKTDSDEVTQFANKNFGQYGDGDGQFRRPEDVAVGPDGRVYVADTGNHRVQVFDKDGAYVGEIGWYGDGDGEFNSPSGVAVSGWVLKAGTNPLGPARVADYFYLYVADTGNHRVQRFKISAPPKAAGGFGFQTTPFDFTHDGNMGSYGDADGLFNLPEGIAADPIDTPDFLAPEMFQLPIVPEQWVGHVYVADQFNHRIQYFELTGAFAGKWGTYGDADDQFRQPQDVAVGIRLEDPIKNKGKRFVDVYVADTGNHQVKQFDETGTHQDTIGSYGDADGLFNSPNGLAVDRMFQQIDPFNDYPKSVGVDGDLFVIDSLNHRGQRFERTEPP